MKRFILITVIIVVLLSTMASADGALTEIEVEPRIQTTLTKMLESFIQNRLEFHNRQYYAIWLSTEFPKGEEFKMMTHIWADGKVLFPTYYYFDIVITGPVIWTYDNGIDTLVPSDYQLYYYRYYPSTGEYTLHSIRSSFLITNYGSELMFTNFYGPHEPYELGEYTLLNPQGNHDYWGSNIGIYHDIKLYDITQIDPLINSAYHKGYSVGLDVGLDRVINESEAYQKGYLKGKNQGYNEGFADGQTTTDETTRNILAFGGSVIGSIFSFILYVSTSVEILGIRLLDVLVALAIISILVFVLKLIKG